MAHELRTRVWRAGLDHGGDAVPGHLATRPAPETQWRDVAAWTPVCCAQLRSGAGAGPRGAAALQGRGAAALARALMGEVVPDARVWRGGLDGGGEAPGQLGTRLVPETPQRDVSLRS